MTEVPASDWKFGYDAKGSHPSLSAKTDAEKNVIEQISNTLRNKMEKHQINECEPQKTGRSTANINSDYDSSNTSYIPSTSISSPNESSNEFREVDCDYSHYELNENGEIKKRLIVKEANRKFAREYTVTGNEEDFKCLNCEIGIARKVVNGYLVSIKHECAPILYETIQTTQKECNTKNVAYSLKKLLKSLKEIQEQQSSYIKGRKRPKEENATAVESKRIRKSGTTEGQEIDLEVGEESKRSLRSATKNKQNNQNASNIVEATPSPINESNNENASGDRLNTPEPYAPSSSITVIAEDVQNEQIDEVLDNNKSVPKIDPTTFKFYLPSSSDFEKYCKMLQLDDFSHEAYKFWANEIDIKNIRPSSIPNKLYSLTSSEKTGYASLTLFLTGSETQTSTIKQTFERIYFFINMADIGNKYYGENLSQTSDSKSIGILLAEDLTKYHLQGFCQFFECRIGVFVDEKWERYGNWENENANVLTLLMKKEGEKFCPVLSLKQ
uniref:Uncharacterized protein n=1 Tax=Panagrolaimus davidi TaxID=227884 RepID=A0A914R1Y0_9BILA